MVEKQTSGIPEMNKFLDFLSERKKEILADWNQLVTEQIQVLGEGAPPRWMESVSEFFDRMIDLLRQVNRENGPLHVGLLSGLNMTPFISAVRTPEEASTLSAIMEACSHLFSAILEFARREYKEPPFEALLLLSRAMDLYRLQGILTFEQRYQEEMNRAVQDRELLIGIVSHELRTPLATILMTTDLLLRRTNTSDAQTRALRRIAMNGEQMQRIVKDLMDFTRWKLGGGVELHVSPMNLGILCQCVIDEASLSHSECHVHFQRRGSLEGMWDEGRLRQVVTNLLMNAIEHHDPQTLISVECIEEKGEMQVRVTNRGPVIPPDRLPLLFDAFQRGETAPTHLGLGLGLYIARKIIEAHGGMITVQSTEKEGTTFTARLPAHSSA